jgi:carbonic anhydrase/acetyltransferase-like protein (isoleucine patch superfamily)
MRYAFAGFAPQLIGEGHYIAPSADVIGRVELGPRSSVWFGAVLRGDTDWIRIGSDTNVQDLSLLHIDQGTPMLIGNRVTIGHQVLLHSCTIGDDSLIGNGAIVLDGAEVGAECLIGAGSLIPPGKKIPPRSLVMGAPYKIIRELSDEEVLHMATAWKHYVQAAVDYRDAERGLVAIGN